MPEQEQEVLDQIAKQLFVVAKKAYKEAQDQLSAAIKEMNSHVFRKPSKKDMEKLGGLLAMLTGLNTKFDSQAAKSFAKQKDIQSFLEVLPGIVDGIRKVFESTQELGDKLTEKVSKRFKDQQSFYQFPNLTKDTYNDIQRLAGWVTKIIGSDLGQKHHEGLNSASTYIDQAMRHMAPDVAAKAKR